MSTEKQPICVSNHMFKSETWDKFTECVLPNFLNLLRKARVISKFQKSERG